MPQINDVYNEKRIKGSPIVFTLSVLTIIGMILLTVYYIQHGETVPLY